MGELRARGLTFEEIGLKMGITRQGVSEVLSRMGRTAAPVRCQACKKVLAEARRAWWFGKKESLLCLACLAKTPDPELATLLASFRVAAGLTQKTLAERAGMELMSISKYERGASVPQGPQLIRLLRALGVRWAMNGQTGGW
jgi:transcriptional regulator with XRE-family HTH domain